jgi:hypothetical protein
MNRQNLELKLENIEKLKEVEHDLVKVQHIKNAARCKLNPDSARMVILPWQCQLAGSSSFDNKAFGLSLVYNLNTHVFHPQ